MSWGHKIVRLTAASALCLTLRSSQGNEGWAETKGPGFPNRLGREQTPAQWGLQGTGQHVRLEEITLLSVCSLEHKKNQPQKPAAHTPSSAEFSLP